MSRKIIGLDVRQDTLSAVLVDSSLRDSQLKGVVHIAMPEAETFADSLSAALQTLTEQMDVSGAVCIAGFPPEQVSYRNLQLPFTGKKKIGQVLPFELEPMLPYPIDDLITDFHTIQKSDGGNLTDVIAMSVEKDAFAGYLAALKSHGLDPNIVSIGGFPTIHFLNSLADMPENWLLADLGEDRCTLFLVVSGEIRLVRPFPIPRSADSKAQSLFGIIRQTLTAFSENLPDDVQFEKILLTGSGLTRFAEEDRLALETMLEIPVKQSEISQHLDGRVRFSAEKAAPSAAVDHALTLALAQIEGRNGLNLRKGPFATRKNWAEHRQNLITLGGFALVILVLFFINIFIDVSTTERRLENLDRQIHQVFRSTFPDIQRIVDPHHQMEVALNEIKQTAFMPGDTENPVRIIDVLNDISQRIPDTVDVELTRLVIDNETVLVSGNTDNFNAVDDIQSRLEDSPLFTKVTISSTNRDQNENRIRFKMKVDL